MVCAAHQLRPQGEWKRRGYIVIDVDTLPSRVATLREAVDHIRRKLTRESNGGSRERENRSSAVNVTMAVNEYAITRAVMDPKPRVKGTCVSQKDR